MVKIETHSKIVKLSYGFLRRIAGIFMRLFLVKKTTGFHNIPKKGAAVIAMNHQSFFDFLSMAAVAPRNIHFLAAEKFFNHKYWRMLMIATGQIKVDRQAKDKEEALAGVHKHLEKKTLVGIFPEGTRSHLPDEMLKAYNGVAKFALKNHVPIIPAGIIGAHEVLGKGDKKIKIKKVIELHVGRPMDFSQYWDMQEDKEICTYITEKVMKEIEKLSGKSYPHCESLKHNDFIDKNIALVDMDGTLSKDQSQKLFIKYLFNKKYINKTELLVIYTWFAFYKLGLLSNPKRALKYALKKFTGHSEDLINQEVEFFYNEVLKDNLYEQSFDFANKLKEHGFLTILTSAAVEPIVKKVSKELGFDHYLSTKLELNNGLITGNTLGNAHHGVEKIHSIIRFLENEKINPKKIIAITDHQSDIPLLEYSHHPIIANPHRKMLKYSKGKNIPVLYLNNDELFQYIKLNIIGK